MTESKADVHEYARIAAVVQRYIDGARSGRGDDMRSAFHEKATIFGYVGDDLFAGPIEKLFAWNEENGPAKDLVSQIASIDLVGTVATVRLEIENWTGYRFTDLFTMLRLDGEWKIMNKVFHLHS